MARAALASLGVALVLLGTLWLRRPIQRQLASLAAQARAPTQTAVGPTLEAIALSLAWAPWGPALIAYLSKLMTLEPRMWPAS